MLSSAQAIASRAPLAAQRRGAQPAARRSVQTQALWFFAAPKAKAGPSKAKELVDTLIELTARTDGGLAASPAKRAQIEELVGELEAFCPRNPLRSPLLFGEYEVLYASKPQTAGGPFRSGLGRTVFPGQRVLQIIEEPNICVNEVSYKTLGFIPGKARQEGEIQALSGDTFQLTFPELDGKRKGGPMRRVIQIAYLDERVRVARFVPPEDEEDAEPSFYVFRRLGAEEEEEEAPAPAPKRAPVGTRKLKAQADKEPEEAAPARRAMLGTQLLGRKEGLATMAERRYAQQQGSRGTGPKAAGGSRPTGSRPTRGTSPTRGASPTPSGTQARKTREEIAAERAAAKAAQEEQRRAAQEAAAKAKAAQEEERRKAREAAEKAKAKMEEERRVKAAQQEAERARLAELKEKAKEQLAALQGEAVAALDDAKEAAATVKDAEKAAAELLKQASQARMVIDQAAGRAASAAEQAESLKQQERAAAAQVAEARAVLKDLAAAGRRK